VEDVALKLGYSKTKTLQMHLRAVFGLTAGELRVTLSTEEALEGARGRSRCSSALAFRPPASGSTSTRISCPAGCGSA
jgi:hypothetical protein